MAMSRQTAERLARIHAHNQLDREAIARGKREQEERAEKKLLAELELEEQRAVPPAEASPGLPPAEVAKRLEVLERERKEPFTGGLRTPVPEVQLQRANRRREQLRLLRNRKEAEADSARQNAHEQRCAGLIQKFESGIAELETERDRLLDRHRAELDNAEGRLAEQRSKLSGLILALAPGETSEDREKAVLGS